MSTTTPHFGWPQAAVVIAMLGFFAFVLYLNADHFDVTEWRSLGGFAVGLFGKEFWPTMRAMLLPTTQALGRGGQVE